MLLTPLINKIKAQFTSDLKKIDWTRTALLVVTIVAVYFAAMSRLMPEIREVNTKTFKNTVQIQKVKDVQRVFVKCPEAGIQTLDKHQVAEKLNLPWLETPLPSPLPQRGEGTNISPPFMGGGQGEGLDDYAQDDPADLQVTATAELPQSKHAQQVLSVINTDTGVTSLVAKDKPLPWFKPENAGHVGLWYGLNEHLQQNIQADATWRFLQIKAIHLAIKGDLSTGGDGHIMAGTIYEW